MDPDYWIAQAASADNVVLDAAAIAAQNERLHRTDDSVMDIEKIAPELDRQIVLYCGGGFRSALAADALQQMGYTNVLSMSEGWRGWNERGLPTE